MKAHSTLVSDTQPYSRNAIKGPYVAACCQCVRDHHTFNGDGGCQVSVECDVVGGTERDGNLTGCQHVDGRMRGR